MTKTWPHLICTYLSQRCFFKNSAILQLIERTKNGSVKREKPGQENLANQTQCVNTSVLTTSPWLQQKHVVSLSLVCSLLSIGKHLWVHHLSHNENILQSDDYYLNEHSVAWFCLQFDGWQFEKAAGQGSVKKGNTNEQQQFQMTWQIMTLLWHDIFYNRPVTSYSAYGTECYIMIQRVNRYDNRLLYALDQLFFL